MRTRIVGLAIALAVLFLLSILTTFQIATAMTPTTPHIRIQKQDRNELRGGEPTTFMISVTLHPSDSASLVYMNADGTLAQLNFPPHTTDVTRTIYLITETSTSAPGMVFTGYAFGLIPFRNGVIDKQYRFLRPVSVTIEYRDDIVPIGMSEIQIELYHSTTSQWIRAGDTCNPPLAFQQDTDLNTMTGFICAPAYYGIFGAHRHYLPSVWKS